MQLISNDGQASAKGSPLFGSGWSKNNAPPCANASGQMAYPRVITKIQASAPQESGDGPDRISVYDMTNGLPALTSGFFSWPKQDNDFTGLPRVTVPPPLSNG